MMKIPAVEQIMCFFFVFSENTSTIFDHRRIITIIPLAQVLGQAPCAELSKVEFDWHSEAPRSDGEDGDGPSSCERQHR
jgi:hypothetical protein